MLNRRWRRNFCLKDTNIHDIKTVSVFTNQKVSMEITLLIKYFRQQNYLVNENVFVNGTHFWDKILFCPLFGTIIKDDVKL